MKSYVWSLFIVLFVLGCNSQYADLNPITTRAPFIVQLGAKTKIAGFNNLGTDTCNDIAVDRFENVICAGTTNGSMARTSDTTNDGFVAKFDRSGKLLWITQLASENNRQDNCSSVDVDYAGNIYCGGSTTGRIGTGEILNKNAVFAVLERTTAATDTDGFVAKITPSGSVAWITQFGSYGEDFCNNIAVSPSGNAYCGARTNGEIGTDAISNTYEYLSSTSINPLIVKIDTNGLVKWIRQFGVLSVGSEHVAEDYCSGVTIDADENVYCAGGTRGVIADTNGSPGGMDAFIWIVDKNGFTVDKLQIGVTVSSNANTEVINVNSDEYCLDVAVDKNKNIYCTVALASTYGENSGGGADGAIVKWNTNHDLEWVTQMGAFTLVTGFSNAGNQYFQGINVTTDGNILVTGSTSGSTAANLNGTDDMLFAKFNSSGELIWARQYGSSGTDVCTNVVSDLSGNIYGACTTTGNIGETNGGLSDAVILRLNSQGQM